MTTELTAVILLAKHFPVWRELKRTLVGIRASARVSLAKHFPVPRELKHDASLYYGSHNGLACQALSRSEGIETKRVGRK